jgi:hypothetical protein
MMVCLQSKVAVTMLRMKMKIAHLALLEAFSVVSRGLLIVVG